MLRKLSTTIALLFVVSGAGCLGGSGPGTEPNPDPVPTTGDPNPQPSGDTLGIAPGSPTSSADPDNTFDHMNENDVDPFAVLGRIQEQGPPEISTKMHSCQKLKYATLGSLLTQLGVNLARNAAAGQPQSAGQLYRGGVQALGAPNYGARMSEAVELTTSGATKLFDIFVQAAPEIIAAMPANTASQVNGQAIQMFDANGRCTMEGITFIQGSPANQAQKDLCDQVINQASSQTIGRTIAVATILSAAHTCE